MHGDKNTQTFQKNNKLTFQQINYSLNSLFIVRQHEIATRGKIDECHEREISFVVTDKCTISPKNLSNFVGLATIERGIGTLNYYFKSNTGTVILISLIFASTYIHSYSHL